MTSFVARYMQEDWFESEIHEIVDLFLRADIRTVYVTYGFGCDRDFVIQSEDIPVPTDSLARFIEDSEERGIFQLGENDLRVGSGRGNAEFLLCHEHDIHFSGDESPLLNLIRSRWSKKYQKCYEQRDGGRWRLISIPNHRGEKF